MKESVVDAVGAVFSCIHVMRENAPILSAGRNYPIDDEDSGWFVHCGKKNHQDDELLIVSGKTLGSRYQVSSIPALEVGFWCWRLKQANDWTVEQLEEDPENQ